MNNALMGTAKTPAKELRYEIQCKEIDNLIDSLFTRLAPISLPNLQETTLKPEQRTSQLNERLDNIQKRLSQLLQEIDY